MAFRKIKVIGPGKMVWEVKVLAPKPSGLSSFHRTHTTERELIPTRCPLTCTHVLWHELMHIECVHTYTEDI